LRFGSGCGLASPIDCHSLSSAV